MGSFQYTKLARTVTGATALFATCLLSALPLQAQANAAANAAPKPTIAVMEFDNAAMVRRDEFAAMTVGMQVMLTNALATNPNVVVVERQRILEIMKEQDLGTAGRLDPATAAKVGKILGAQYVLLGAFVVAPDMEMRLSARAVNTETSVLEHVEDVAGKGDKIFKLVDQLAGKLNGGLKLPGQRDNKASKELGSDGPNQLEAMKAMSAARRLEEQGDVKGAIAMYQKTLALNGDLGVVRTRLASIEKSQPK
jgi:TolB-like protein